MKKALKISAIVIGLLLLVIIVLPFVFKGKIEKAVQSEINKNLNAIVTSAGARLPTRDGTILVAEIITKFEYKIRLKV